MGKKLSMMKTVVLQFVATIVILSLSACTNAEQNQKIDSNTVKTNSTSLDTMIENPESNKTENGLKVFEASDIRIANNITIDEEILNHDIGIPTSTIISDEWDVQTVRNFIIKTDEAVLTIRDVDKGVVIMSDPDYPTFALKKNSKPDELKGSLMNYFTEDLIDYVLLMYRFEEWDGLYGFNLENDDSGYQIDPMGTFSIIKQTENQCIVSVPFKYSGLLEITPEESNGSMTIERQLNGEWKITQISQWYADFYYYYMDREELQLYNMDKKEFDELIRDFGTDEKGNRMPMKINCDENRVILKDSNMRQLTEIDLTELTKFGKYLAYHEIYARHGKIFEDNTRKQFFSWWDKSQEDIVWEHVLSEIEKENLKFIEQRIK